MYISTYIQLKITDFLSESFHWPNRTLENYLSLALGEIVLMAPPHQEGFTWADIVAIMYYIALFYFKFYCVAGHILQHDIYVKYCISIGS